MIICHCFAVTDTKIRKYCTLKDVKDYTLAGTGCGRCVIAIEEILESAQNNGDRKLHKDP